MAFRPRIGHRAKPHSANPDEWAVLAARYIRLETIAALSDEGVFTLWVILRRAPPCVMRREVEDIGV